MCKIPKTAPYVGKSAQLKKKHSHTDRFKWHSQFRWDISFLSPNSLINEHITGSQNTCSVCCTSVFFLNSLWLWAERAYNCYFLTWGLLVRQGQFYDPSGDSERQSSQGWGSLGWANSLWVELYFHHLSSWAVPTFLALGTGAPMTI